MMDPDKRKALGQKAKKYVSEEFSYQKTVDMWNDTLTKLVDDSKKNPKRRWTLEEINGVSK